MSIFVCVSLMKRCAIDIDFCTMIFFSHQLFLLGQTYLTNDLSDVIKQYVQDYADFVSLL